MILGIGIDLIEIPRIEQALARHGERFAQRILSRSEYARFQTHAKPAAYLAKRFAAKEAFSKALGTGIRTPVTWRNIGVMNHSSGRPHFEFEPALKTMLESRGVLRAHVSLTDEREMAAAYVVLEGENDA
ncbi:MAG TPA: holo-ACP synthase [Burkholderiales bacterium]|nr:holo-ACP synthase [Burkholderiales bacterium]